MTEVYRRHERNIILQARHVCGPDDAADVAQEVFLKLWRNPTAFDPDKSSLETYLAMLARGIAVDSVRSDVRRRQRDARAIISLGPVDISSDHLVFEPFVRKEVILRVGSALGDIDPRHRHAIMTRYLDDVSYDEVARRSGVPVSTAKSRVRLGLQRLRPAIADLHDVGRDDRAEDRRRLVRIDGNVATPPARRALPHRRAVIASLALLAPIASACGSQADTNSLADPARITIATTVAPITSIVSNIVGDRADVTGIVPEGTNSHTFEPRPSDAELLAVADVVYMNGLMLEEPIRALAKANISDNAELIELGNLSISDSEHIFDFSFPERDGKPNPHLWTDPMLVRRYAQIVTEDISQRDPANSDYYRSNYEAFAEAISELDTAMRVAFATVPKRELLTYHDAYAYFARTYDWNVIGAIQISDFEDPRPSEVADLIDQLRASGVPAIFGSEVFPSPVLEQIGREAGVDYVDTLRDDDLPGEPGDAEHSWFGLMRSNFVTMTEALGGDARALRSIVADAVPDSAFYPQ